ncbi:hypothetical protein BCR32DRAFT_285322 [Anaeromyces robustus]|uniref:Uncharacterized protein n=1 Tax=Anaeromyces robustus TaxID=1754192 RepID=A0A1Y1WP32_9FUNG|nr:hypothetical protein BCR32DRAFT_285322 [Anaeromyces robustus]|eukprot:ORX75297.1 hypothetical protein BCR32DRAFT_285322 [Anaeromyces robustus]
MYQPQGEVQGQQAFQNTTYDDDEYVYITDDEGDFLEDEEGNIFTPEEAQSRGLLSPADEGDRALNFQNLSKKQILLAGAAVAGLSLLGGGAYLVNKQLKKKKKVKKSELTPEQKQKLEQKQQQQQPQQREW